MKKLNRSQFIILGLLLRQSYSGYEILEIIKRSTHFFWHESDASIYPTLKRLAIEGKVSSEIRASGKRKKEVFTITNSGREAFDKWFEMPPEHDQTRREFLLKLFFTEDSRQETMTHHFERYLKELKDTLKTFNNIEELLKNLPLEECPSKAFRMDTLQNGLAHLELDIRWAKNKIKEYKKC